jgi:hypothetical protein
LLAGVSLPAASAAFAQCVTDVLTVDACLGGVRLTAPTTPPGATLNLNFMTPGTLDPRITFTRASTATYFDSTGTMQTAAINAPRWDYDPATLLLRGLLMEEARINVLLNSATLGTQSVVVTAQAYTLSFYGTGTVTKSGAATGALVGTGAQRVTQTFTPTAGTLTLTVTGAVTNAQLEAGSFVTSWIPTTGASATRATEQMFVLTTGWINPAAGTLLVNTSSPEAVASAAREYVALGTDANTTTRLFTQVGTGVVSAQSFNANVNSGTVNDTLPLVANQQFKAALSYNSAPLSLAVSRSGTVPSKVVPTGAAGGLATLYIGGGSRSIGASACYRGVVYWGRVLSDAEMQQVTT